MFAFHSIYFDDKPVEGRVVDIFESPGWHEVALFFVHGGGWSSGSRSIFHKIIAAAVERGFDCASTDYRLGGVSVFDQVADVRRGLDLFLLDLARRKREVPIVLIGSSAGAHLILLAGLASPSECGLPDVPLLRQPRIAAIVVQSAPFTFVPWPDIFPPIWSAMQKAVGTSYAERPDLFEQASPEHHVRSGMPRIFMMHAENEHMFPPDQARSFLAKAESCGGKVLQKTYPRTEHGFFFSLDRWQQKEAFEDVIHFAETGQISDSPS